MNFKMIQWCEILIIKDLILVRQHINVKKIQRFHTMFIIGYYLWTFSIIENMSFYKVHIILKKCVLWWIFAHNTK
jgi:hypothetical protein